MMTFKIITIFPEAFAGYLSVGLLAKAQRQQIVDVQIYNLRDWTDDPHRSVDDRPFGGGAGMVMRIEPLYRALQAVAGPQSHKILLSAKGQRWQQPLAEKYTDFQEIVLICGRYEGVDERIKEFIDAEISIGDFVLTGGELPALTLIDSVTRLLPGVLGNSDSLKDESHGQLGWLEYPQYTRPEIFQAEGHDYGVPPVLLSGNHAAIDTWRQNNAKKSS